MPKGEQKGNREAKKPKKVVPKVSVAPASTKGLVSAAPAKKK